MSVSKIELRKKLRDLGIKVVRGNYIRKKDITAILSHNGDDRLGMAVSVELKSRIVAKNGQPEKKAVKKAIVDELKKSGWDLSFDDPNYTETIDVGKSKKSGFTEILMSMDIQENRALLILHCSLSEEDDVLNLEMNLTKDDKGKWGIDFGFKELNRELHSYFA